MDFVVDGHEWRGYATSRRPVMLEAPGNDQPGEAA
jgi:hypothetical protein